MNDDTSRNPIDWSNEPDAARLRGIADGECSDTASDADRVRFEQTLRERVCSCMGSCDVPADLRGRITSAMAEDSAADLGTGADDPLVRRDQSFWRGGKQWIGLAAVMALVVTAFVLTRSNTPPANSAADLIFAQVAESVSDEHGCCRLNPEHLTVAGVSFESETEPAAYIAEQIGDLPVRLELGRHGFKLAGVGGCELPGSEKAVHLMYEPLGGHGGKVSLFIQNATSKHDGLSEGTVYTNSPDDETSVRIWREGQVVYYMATVCPVGCSTVESAYALTGDRVAL